MSHHIHLGTPCKPFVCGGHLASYLPTRSSDGQSINQKNRSCGAICHCIGIACEPHANEFAMIQIICFQETHAHGGYQHKAAAGHLSKKKIAPAEPSVTFFKNKRHASPGFASAPDRQLRYRCRPAAPVKKRTGNHMSSNHSARRFPRHRKI